MANVSGELPCLWVLDHWIEFNRNEPPLQILGHRQPVAGEDAERSRIQRNCLRLSENAHTGWPLSEHAGE